MDARPKRACASNVTYADLDCDEVLDARGKRGRYDDDFDVDQDERLHDAEVRLCYECRAPGRVFKFPYSHRCLLKSSPYEQITSYKFLENATWVSDGATVYPFKKKAVCPDCWGRLYHELNFNEIPWPTAVLCGAPHIIRLHARFGMVRTMYKKDLDALVASDVIQNLLKRWDDERRQHEAYLASEACKIDKRLKANERARNQYQRNKRRDEVRKYIASCGFHPPDFLQYSFYNNYIYKSTGCYQTGFVHAVGAVAAFKRKWITMLLRLRALGLEIDTSNERVSASRYMAPMDGEEEYIPKLTSERHWLLSRQRTPVDGEDYRCFLFKTSTNNTIHINPTFLLDGFESLGEAFLNHRSHKNAFFEPYERVAGVTEWSPAVHRELSTHAHFSNVHTFLTCITHVFPQVHDDLVMAIVRLAAL